MTTSADRKSAQEPVDPEAATGDSGDEATPDADSAPATLADPARAATTDDEPTDAAQATTDNAATDAAQSTTDDDSESEAAATDPVDTATTPAATEKSPSTASPLRRTADTLIAKFGAATLAFTVLAALFGAVFAVITPPFWGHDEITQFGRAYQVAHGGFLPQEIEDDRGVAYGGKAPAAIDALMGVAIRDYTENPEEPAPMVGDPGAYDRVGSAEITAQQNTIWFTNTAAYSPVPYLPAAIGIRLAELTGLDAGGMVLLTRLAGLLAYLVVVGFALWALRHYRVQWLAFSVALLPIAVFQAGTVTADTMTNALAIMVSALLVKALFLGRGLGRVETTALLAATVLLPLSKPTYVLLAMLVVLVPAKRFGFSGLLRWLPWLCAAIGAAGFAVWMKIAAPTGDGMSLMRPRHQWYTVNPGEQLGGILRDPIGFLGVFGESIARRDQEWFTEFFGELGFGYVDVPAMSIVTCLLAFAVGLGIAERMSTPDFRRTLVVALTLAASVAMIYVTLYMSFTPIDFYIIDGVQGRYFVPLAILTFAVLLRWMPLRLTGPGGKAPGRAAPITIMAATTIALAAAAIKYYVVVWG
ncbi:DUF2142 domain-containing protein [Nocardia cyriacigeorgica]|uniref:DUF2142 domain-containing protein n=1 Tax=Nocardia cyriacigeorgica TaxID=135487 RepID=UPI0018937D78|nr:DUF2142 domain-containing protein [Nocardia cyriacigeorgica]MBF6289590.1 DUF2142 domain-containing protein [Nocardia cyriacigeorgica]